MSIKEIGCCGAYCKTCRAFNDKSCRGCKAGYDNGDRDIIKAKCKIKICCIIRGHNTCADCIEFSSCPIINVFYSKNGYKYAKYKQATKFISDKGYTEFLMIAEGWTNAYGRYE